MVIIGLVFLMSQSLPVSALIGIGAHYGIDLTLKMDNKLMEQTQLDNLKFSLSGLPSIPGINPDSVLTGKDIPVYINRKDWKNTGINFGGKIYVDVLPFIDALEVSTNFGVWQYNGSVLYPKSITPKYPPPAQASRFQDLVDVTYDTLQLSIKKIYPNRYFWGVTETPYAKLHFDATIRKYLLQLPPVIKILKIYGGAGMSVDFATPMLSSKLIDDALRSYSSVPLSSDIFSSQDLQKKIIDQIINNMMTPHYGCHIALGSMIKLPMIPLGFYIDAKYIIRFDKMDKYVDIGGNGFLINLGAALAF